MSRKKKTEWYEERTLADAEAAAEQDAGFGNATDRCICGSTEYLLEAYLHVVDGKIDPKPVEVETLTCPECGREYEALLAENGGILRGDYVGQTDLDDEDDY